MIIEYEGKFYNGVIRYSEQDERLQLLQSRTMGFLLHKRKQELEDEIYMGEIDNLIDTALSKYKRK